MVKSGDSVEAFDEGELAQVENEDRLDRLQGVRVL
jgi:hypothetical protein